MPSMTPLRWLKLVLAIATLFVIWPLWPSLVLAVWTAELMRPLLLKFERGLNGRTRAAAMLTVLLFLVLGLPVVLMLLGVVAGAQELITTVQHSPSAGVALKALMSTPDSEAVMPSTLTEVLSLLQRSGSQGFEMVRSMADAAATGLIGLFLYFGGAYALLFEGRSAWRWVKAHSPFAEAHLDQLGAAFHETGRGLLVGVGLTTLTQGVAATIIYFSLGVPRAGVLGPITGLASIIPFVGSSLVWGPIALSFFLTGHPVKSLILVVLGVGVISLIDNVVRPLFARVGHLKMPAFVLFVSVFGGLAAFGAWGALMGPLIVRLLMEALTISREPPGPVAT